MDKRNAGGSVLLWLITGALIIFTATRSVHLIQSTMPADYSIMAYAALAGLDGGVLAWLFWTTRTAHSGVQRTIGTLMIIVDLAGIAAAVLGDTMLVSGANADLVGTVAIWIVPVVIVANVASCVVAHVADPAQELRDADRAVMDELQRQKAQYLVNNAATIAASIADKEGQHHAAEMVAAFASKNGNNKQVYASEGTRQGKVKSQP